MESGQQGNNSTMTEQKVRDMDETAKANTGIPDTPALDEKLSEAVEGRIHHLGHKITSYAEEHHINELPEKAKNVLSTRTAKAIIGTGALAVIGFIGKKWRDSRQHAQPSFTQKIKAKIPLTHS